MISPSFDEILRGVSFRKPAWIINFYSIFENGNLITFRNRVIAMAEGVDESFSDSLYGYLRNLFSLHLPELYPPIDMFGDILL